jgi:6-phosphogluconolactonase (cycloisomerase 2 family)
MRLFARTALALGLLTLTVAVTTAPAGAAPTSDVVGHLYVDDNTAGANTVAGFDRHGDGTLTPLPGSPFSVGGAGTGIGIGSQGALQLSADGRYLLAADAGSNQISVLRIKPDGGLTEAESSPVWSGGNLPVSIAVHDGLVYVANAGSGASNYTGFTLNAGGHLRPLTGSTFALPDGSSPGDVLFNGDGSRLVGTRVGPSLIDSFTVGSSGLLTPAPGSPFVAQGPGPFGSEFSPTHVTQLFVSNAHGGAGNGTVSAFNDADNGVLSPIGSSPFADLQTAPCWVEISHDGKYLFTVNTASSTISRYSIAADGTLTLLGSTPFNGKGAFDARLAPDGATLWVVDDGSNAVSGLKVNGGDLSELTSSPTSLPAGAAPFGIVVT